MTQRSCQRVEKGYIGPQGITAGWDLAREVLRGGCYDEAFCWIFQGRVMTGRHPPLTGRDAALLGRGFSIPQADIRGFCFFPFLGGVHRRGGVEGGGRWGEGGEKGGERGRGWQLGPPRGGPGA